VASGTYALWADQRGLRTTTEHGLVDHELESPALGLASVDRELAVDVDASIPGRGSARMIVALDEYLGTQDWSIDAQIGQTQTEGGGASIHRPLLPSDTEALESTRVTGTPPASVADVRPEAGSMSLDLDQQFTGDTGPATTHLATWAWSGADLAELYGWSYEEIVKTGGPETQTPTHAGVPGGPSQSLPANLERDTNAEGPVVCAHASFQACLEVPLAR
jgi:hypothetical protein